MKKFSNITPEQYAALKKHLKLVDRSHFPSDDAEIDKLPSTAFPCYFFDPGKLAEKDDDILAVTLLGRRNPWNCAQLIAAMMPQVLNYIPEEPWYKELAKEVWSRIRKYGRNFLALIKRIRLAWRHHDEEEILYAILHLVMEGFRVVVIAGFYTCIVAGFFKPHCFITALFYLILIAIVNSTIADFRNERVGHASRR